MFKMHRTMLMLGQQPIFYEKGKIIGVTNINFKDNNAFVRHFYLAVSKLSPKELCGLVALLLPCDDVRREQTCKKLKPFRQQIFR